MGGILEGNMGVGIDEKAPTESLLLLGTRGTTGVFGCGESRRGRKTNKLD